MTEVLPFKTPGVDQDRIFFLQFPHREAHIRPAFDGEMSKEFQSLGMHDSRRRKMLVWKVPQEALRGAGQLLKMPFLAFADEEIRDDDATLLPIIHELMVHAGATYGVDPRRG